MSETKESKNSEKDEKLKHENENNSNFQQENDINKENSAKQNEDNNINNENDEIADLKNSLLRIAAEFDNYKKRSIKEKQKAYEDAKKDTLKNLLDAFDNLERAYQICKDEESELSKGIKMTMNHFYKALEKLGVEQINPLNEKFDALLHNAVMHVEDEKLEKDTVCEVFQKGYKCGDTVIRFAMVKVAN